MVAIEQRKEAGLGTGCALDTAETKVVPGTLDVAQIPEELLKKTSVCVMTIVAVCVLVCTCNQRVVRLPTVVNCAG